MRLAIEESVTPHSTEDLAEHLDTLYCCYVDEVDFLATEEPMVTGNTDIDSDVENAEITVSLTRSQREVGEGERQIWIALSEGTELPELASEISDLADRSETICHSYRRTAELPGEDTFSESRMMIEAMGVPWIESGAEFEAEAFASSIVLHGLADYVASEDTVRDAYHSHWHTDNKSHPTTAGCPCISSPFIEEYHNSIRAISPHIWL